MSRFSPIIRKIILDLADNREKEYSPTGKHIGPKGGRFDYLDEIEKHYKSVGHIKKDSYGNRQAGKHIGGDIYFHKDHIPEQYKEQVLKAHAFLPIESDEHVIIKIAKDGTVSFIKSPDWDTATEPSITKSTTVSPSGSVKSSEYKHPTVYHHKWQFVPNDYKGFDVGASKKRSVEWENHPYVQEQIKINPRFKSTIGSKKNWDEISKNIKPVSDDYHPENTSINSTKPSSGISKAVKLGLIKPGDTVLDYGGGKFDAGKNHIESSIEGSKVHIFDPFSRSKEHNDSVMGEFKDKRADVVMNHNVLNVIPTPAERKEVLTSAYNHVKPGGTFIVSVYVGNQSGTGNKVVKKNGWNWQENRKTADYMDEIQKALPDAKVVRKGELIIITKP